MTRKPTKKRKIADVSVELPQESAPSKDDIRDRLSKCPPNKVAKALLKSVETASSSELQAIQSLLGSLLEKAHLPLHCARCHQEYNEPENDDNSCQIEHSEGAVRGSRGRGTYSCCGQEFDLRRTRCYHSDSPGDYCFSGRHTSDSEEVYYSISYSEEGNSNILTCRAKGCASGNYDPLEDERCPSASEDDSE